MNSTDPIEVDGIKFIPVPSDPKPGYYINLSFEHGDADHTSNSEFYVGDVSINVLPSVLKRLEEVSKIIEDSRSYGKEINIDSIDKIDIEGIANNYVGLERDSVYSNSNSVARLIVGDVKFITKSYRTFIFKRS